MFTCPSNTIDPVPFGSNSISPSEADTNLFPFTSKFSLGNIVLIPISPASLINNTEEFSFLISKIFKN